MLFHTEIVQFFTPFLILTLALINIYPFLLNIHAMNIHSFARADVDKNWRSGEIKIVQKRQFLKLIR